jgi:hypothetical protein
MPVYYSRTLMSTVVLFIMLRAKNGSWRFRILSLCLTILLIILKTISYVRKGERAKKKRETYVTNIFHWVALRCKKQNISLSLNSIYIKIIFEDEKVMQIELNPYLLIDKLMLTLSFLYFFCIHSKEKKDIILSGIWVIFLILLLRKIKSTLGIRSIEKKNKVYLVILMRNQEERSFFQRKPFNSWFLSMNNKKRHKKKSKKYSRLFIYSCYTKWRLNMLSLDRFSFICSSFFFFCLMSPMNILLYTYT